MSQANILLIIDDAIVSKYLAQELTERGGYAVFAATNSYLGLEAFKRNAFGLVILRFGMPDFKSTDLIRELKKIDPDCVVIGFIDDTTQGSSGAEFYGAGVYEVFSRPIDLARFFFLVKKGLELHTITSSSRKFSYGLQEQNLSLQKQNFLLVKRIEESTKNLSRLYEDLRLTSLQAIKAFAQAIDARDHYTHSHSRNVAKYATVIAEAMRLSPKDVELIRDACELHDLGKIGIQDSILLKPSSLTPEEREQIKRHPVIGAEIIAALPLLSSIVDLIRQHHEHYDGTGYPDGLKGPDTLLGARIIHLADAYEAMRTPRSYRPVPLLKEEALAEIRKYKGIQFDPAIVAEFEKVIDKLESL